MYTSFFGFRGRPFQLSPDHRFFFESQAHLKAMAYLAYGLSQGEGFIVITGEIGAGKTTVVDHLLAQLDGSKLTAAKIVTTQVDADDILRLVALAFGLEVVDADKATLLRRLELFLMQHQKSGRRVLLVVDEGQNLPSRALEELRMLSNFQLREKSLFQIYLVGQPQLRRTLQRPDLEQLRQRVIASYHLKPLEARETRGYIEHRLRHVGWENDPTFDDSAFRAIHDHTHGVPRRINLLCERILLYGCLESRHHIDRSIVMSVVAELHEEALESPAADEVDLQSGLTLGKSKAGELAFAPEACPAGSGPPQKGSARETGDAADRTDGGVTCHTAQDGGQQPNAISGRAGEFVAPTGGLAADELAKIADRIEYLQRSVRAVEERLKRVLSCIEDET